MFPMNRKVLQQSVVIEYDCRKQRKRREYPTSFAARTAFCRLDKQGRNPRVVAKSDTHSLKTQEPS